MLSISIYIKMYIQYTRNLIRNNRGNEGCRKTDEQSLWNTKYIISKEFLCFLVSF